MAAIALFSGSFCHGESVADAVCRKLGCERLDHWLMQETSARRNVPEEKLHRALHGGSPSLFSGKYPRERERLLAYLKISLLEAAAKDNVLCHGFASLLWDRAIAHVLRVCLIAPLEFRVGQAGREPGLSAKEAQKRIHKDDEACAEWTQRLFHLAPWDARLYDILVPMNNVTMDEASAIIIENAGKAAVQMTPQSQQALQDSVLAAEVGLALIEKGEGLDIACSGGEVQIEINKSVLRVEAFQEELKALAAAVPGVRSVEFRIGSHFRQPAIMRDIELDVPSKVLLVDD
ncbi:MAG TPA: cytidylate kinase family protein, partial [bacterium]